MPFSPNKNCSQYDNNEGLLVNKGKAIPGKKNGGLKRVSQTSEPTAKRKAQTIESGFIALTRGGIEMTQATQKTAHEFHNSRVQSECADNCAQIATQKTAHEFYKSSMRVAQSECADDYAQIDKRSLDPNSDQ